jgi:hypothetical protein
MSLLLRKSADRADFADLENLHRKFPGAAKWEKVKPQYDLR